MPLRRYMHHTSARGANGAPPAWRRLLPCALLSAASTFTPVAAQSTAAPDMNAEALPEFSADFQEPPRLRIDGFGTIGYAHTDNDQGWSFASDIMQRPSKKSGTWFADSKLGLQGSYRLTDDIDAIGQVVLRQQGESAPWHQSVEWAMLSWRPAPDWQLRLGRTNPAFFLISDYRNVSFAYPWIRPNVEFYGFSSIPHIDGIEVIRTSSDEGRHWQFKFGYGNGKATTGNLSQTSREPDTIETRNAMQFVVSREYNGLTLRASHQRAKIRATPSSGPLRAALAEFSQLPIPNVAAEAAAYNEEVFEDDSLQTYTSLGLLYDRNDWIVHTEASLIGSKFKKALASRRGYFTVGRRLGAATVYFGMGRVKPEADDAQQPTNWTASLTPFVGPTNAAMINEAGEAAANGINELRYDQRSTTLGVRWDIKPTVALNLEWSRTRIFSNGGANWGYATSSDARADVIAATVSFVF